jgi:hypothetical protein
VSDEAAKRIFISYRRTDSPHIAGRLFDRLATRFGAANVFMDVDSIEPGSDFGDAISHAVGSCDALLALIGTHWLDVVDERGRRRLDDPDDLVVLEIASALERQVRVVPVLVDGAAPPRRTDLPDVLAPLARRQVARLDHVSFSTNAAALIEVLERPLAAARHIVPDPSSRPRPDDVEPSLPAASIHDVRFRWEWTVEDFKLLRHDRRPSTRHMISVFDVLAGQPDVQMSMTDLADAVELTRNELRGAFNGFSHVCKLLRPGDPLGWPISWQHRPSTRPDQGQETFYHVPAAVADRWRSSAIG